MEYSSACAVLELQTGQSAHDLCPMSKVPTTGQLSITTGLACVSNLTLAPGIFLARRHADRGSVMQRFDGKMVLAFMWIYVILL